MWQPDMAWSDVLAYLAGIMQTPFVGGAILLMITLAAIVAVVESVRQAVTD